jgi:2-polyprenyl-3-methyl-5-hydroxy-6-metoxy-1,4-benzoquinol methylase
VKHARAKESTQPTVEDVRQYWESHPLLSFELANSGSASYFEALDAIKRSDSDAFAMGYWNFQGYPGKQVLDVGCGPGWLTVQYAMGGAQVSSVDLTRKAVELCEAHLRLRGVTADVRQGNAEELPFGDDTFDMVFSSGVLHHTPDTYKTFQECFRVLKPGCAAKITLYRKGILHHPFVFALTRWVMLLLGVKHPGADLAKESSDVNNFIRMYDGASNPVGIGKTDEEWAALFSAAGFQVTGVERHFFPLRFVPSALPFRGALHRLLDRWLGTMAYFSLQKPASRDAC